MCRLFRGFAVAVLTGVLFSAVAEEADEVARVGGLIERLKADPQDYKARVELAAVNGGPVMEKLLESLEGGPPPFDCDVDKTLALWPAAVPGLVTLIEEGADPGCTRAGVVLSLMGDQAALGVPRLLAALHGEKVTTRAAAATGLSKIKSEKWKITAALLECLGDADPGVVLAVIGAVVNLNEYNDAVPETVTPRLAKCLEHTDKKVVLAALNGLKRLKASAEVMRPGLEHLLKSADPELKMAGVRELNRSGAPAEVFMPTVRELLETKKQDKAAVLNLLGETLREENASAVLPLLLDGLKDPDWIVRRTMAERLGVIGKGHSEVEAALLEALKEPESPARSYIIGALARLGCVQPEFLEVVVEGLDSDDQDRRLACFVGLKDLGPLAVGEADHLLALKLRNPGEEWYVVDALRNMGEGVVPLLATSLESGDPDVASRASKALERMERVKYSTATAANLYGIVRKGPGKAREGALHALAKAEGGSAPHLLAALCTDADEGVCTAAGRELAKLGRTYYDDQAREVSALVMPLLTSPNVEVKAAAMETLVQSWQSNAGDELMARAVAELENPEPRIRAAACRMIGRFGYRAKDRQADLLKALQDGNAEVEKAAAAAFEHVPVDSAEAGAVIEAKLSSPDPAVRRLAVPVARSAGKLDVLFRLLDDPDEGLQLEAAKALRTCGERSTEFARLVFSHLNHPKKEVNELLVEILGLRLSERSGAEAVSIAREAVMSADLAVADTVLRAALPYNLGLAQWGACEPVLTAALESPHEEVRRKAALGLAEAHTGIRAKAASTMLEVAAGELKSRDVTAREKAIDAISSVWWWAQGVLPDLKQALEHETVPDLNKKLGEVIKRVDLGVPWEVTEQEIPEAGEFSGPEWKHYEYALRLEGAEKPIAVARVHVGIGGDEYGREHGTDLKSLRFQWVEPGRILAVTTETLFYGRWGTQGVWQLLLKDGGEWREVFRYAGTSHEGDMHWQASFDVKFSFDAAANVLTCKRSFGSLSYSDEKEVFSVPSEQGTRYESGYGRTCEYRYRIVNGQLEYIDGVARLELPDVEFPIADVLNFAQTDYFAGSNSELTEEQLRQMNPQLEGKQTCSGTVVTRTNLPAFLPRDDYWPYGSTQ